MKKKLFVLGVVAAAVLYLDQMSKALAIIHLQGRPQIVMIDGFFNLVYVENTGAAFGLFAGAKNNIPTPVFHLISALAIGAILYLFFTLKEKQVLLSASLSAILGGAVGNFADRVRLGYVVDFLDFHWKGLHWPAFNIADTAITIGVGLLILDMILGKEGDSYSLSPGGKGRSSEGGCASGAGEEDP